MAFLVERSILGGCKRGKGKTLEENNKFERYAIVRNQYDEMSARQVRSIWFNLI